MLAFEGQYMVSVWKPIVLFMPFVAWAWFASTVMDKHAARFHLGRENWNLFHICMGIVALMAGFLIPGTTHLAFGIGLAVTTAILATDILIYATQTNKDDRVPDAFKIRFDSSTWKQARAEKATSKLAGKAELAIRMPSGKIYAVPQSDTDEFQVRIAAETVYMDAKERQASRIDITPAKDGYAITVLVDGVRQPLRQGVPAAEALKIIDVWKAAAGMDLSDRRRRTTADVKVARHDIEEVVRINTVGAQAGVRLGMLFDPAGAVQRDAKDLGLTDAQYAELKSMVDECQGVVVLGSLGNSGRTTTFYSIIEMHDAYMSNVQTIELEIQRAIEGVRQNVYDPQAEGPEFSTLTRSILRRDPDVVAIAEMPDAATAMEIAKSDHDRTRIYAGLKVEGAVQALATFVKAVGDNELAAGALHGTVSHKLMRRLCENCKVPYQPSPDMLSKLGLPAEKVKQLFKKGGQVLIKNKPDECPACRGTGYFGQIGVFEVYALGDAERDMIRSGDLNSVRTSLRKKGLPSIQQVALLRAVEGVTSVEEVTRITAPKKKPAAPVASGT